MKPISKTPGRPGPLDGGPGGAAGGAPRRQDLFEVYGEEMIEKVVKSSGNSGRVYLPPDWVGRNVNIILID